MFDRIPILGLAAAALTLAATAARADEGMWTFDAFPAAAMRKAHGFAPDAAWLDRVRGASVRLTGGCSASVVSGDGLVLTNHHCVVDCVQSLSTPAKDFVKNGFVTQARGDEKLCPGQQAEIVTSIADVTARVQGAIGTAPARRSPRRATPRLPRSRTRARPTRRRRARRS